MTFFFFFGGEGSAGRKTQPDQKMTKRSFLPAVYSHTRKHAGCARYIHDGRGESIVAASGSSLRDKTGCARRDLSAVRMEGVRRG